MQKVRKNKKKKFFNNSDEKKFVLQTKYSPSRNNYLIEREFRLNLKNSTTTDFYRFDTNLKKKNSPQNTQFKIKQSNYSFILNIFTLPIPIAPLL